MAISYDDLRAELSQARAERDWARTERERLSREFDKTVDLMAKAREQRDEALATAERFRKSAETLAKAHGDECGTLRDELHSARIEIAHVLREHEELRKTIDEIDAEAEKLREERDHYKAQAEGIRKAVRFAAPLRPCEAGSGCSRKVVGPGPRPDLMVPLREFVFNLPPGSSVTFKRGD